jgi:hypothetical protein
MASTYSTNLALELIGTGDQAGTWGVTTNTNLGTLLEQAISGYVTQAVSTGTDTTITIPNGSTGVARNMYIELTGTGGTNTNLIVPANKKLYFIFNNASGAVTVKVSGQTGVSVPAGKKMILVSNGTDIVNGVNYIADFGTNSFTVTNLTATSATITNLIATTASVSDLSATVLRSASATLTHLSATSASITNLALTSLTISSLNITNVTVASATVSSNLTLSGGTANGVLYLNGSKVATSGSALTFDGTNFGVGTSPVASYKIAVNGDYWQGNGSGTLIGTIKNASGWYEIASSSNVLGVQLTSAATTPIRFLPEGSEAMRITSTSLYTASGINVGIGTSSPAVKLQVNGSGQILRVTDGTTGASIYSGSGLFGFNNQTGEDGMFGSTASHYLYFATNGTERLRLDSSGNLGLGVTPSAWGASKYAMQLGSRASLYGASNLTVLGNNYYDNGTNNIYIASAAASDYYQSAGSHVWRTAASGTINTAISFTQAMTLDASGNLGVGTTSPASTLDVVASGVATATIRTSSTTGSRDAKLRLNVPSTGGDDPAGQIEFTYGTGYSVAGSIQMTHTNAAMKFFTGTTERARITSDGQFQVASSLAGSNLLSFTNSSATGYGISMSVNNDSSGTYRYFEGFSSSASAQRIAIYTNGDVKNTNGVFAAFSDAKLKKDIVDAGSQWDDIKALRVRKYKLKDDAEGAVQIGLIAQEVEQVSPGLVNESQDETRDEDGKIVLTGEVTKGVKYSILYMKAVKALQEAMTRIEQLEAKVAALESA